jgi:septum site-determining protein MinD
MPDIYAISSAKGGVGKTTTAANLAATLAAAGHSVVAVDGDIGTPNLGPALGVDVPAGGATIHDVLAGTAELPEATYEGPHGVLVVPGDDELESFRRADPSLLGDVLSTVTGVDYVIVDTSAGLTHESALPLSLADGVLLVSTPDRDALAATRKSLELTRELGGTVAGVSLNRAETDADAPGVEASVLGRIPESKLLARGSAVGEPITVHAPDGDVALAFRRLAARLAVERVPPPSETEAKRRESSASETPNRGADTDVARGAREAVESNSGTAGDDPVTDESPRDDPVTDESPPDEPTADDSADDEPVVDEPAADDPVTDDTGAADTEAELSPDERMADDAVIIDEDDSEEGDTDEDPAAAEARRTVLGETVPESAIDREETERGNAVEYEIDRDAIPFSEDESGDDEDEDDDDDGGLFGRLFRS